MGFSTEADADNLLELIGMHYPNTKFHNFLYTIEKDYQLGQTTMNIHGCKELYFVIFYFPFNIKFTTLKNKFGNKVWNDTKFFHMASIFLPNDTREKEILQEKTISYINLSIRNEVDSIDIYKEIEKENSFQNYKRPNPDDNSSTSFMSKKAKWS